MTGRAAVLLDELERAVAESKPDRSAYALLGTAMTELVGFKVFTVLKLDPDTLRSVRLHSSEPTYPIGGRKQHVRSAWSEAVINRHIPFVAPGLAELRATFPDSAAIEKVGCGSVLAVPIVQDGVLLGTMNLWDRDGRYGPVDGDVALPFAGAIAPLLAGSPPVEQDGDGIPRASGSGT